MKHFRVFSLSIVILLFAKTSHAQTLSDTEIKRNITSINSPLNALMQLEPRVFEYETNKFKDAGFKSGRQLGFLTDNMRAVFPGLVSNRYFSYMYGKNNYRQSSVPTIDAVGLIPLLVASIQEMNTEIERLKLEINTLKGKAGS